MWISPRARVGNTAKMQCMRKSDVEPRKTDRRADRIVCDGERWYVLTREGRRGPFATRRAAEAEARLFVETMQYLERVALPPDLDPSDVTVVDINVMPWG